MAIRTRVITYDDLSGEQIPDGEAQTIRFSLVGVSYEIDLGRDAAKEFLRLLEPYTNAGRRQAVVSPRGTRATQTTNRAHDRDRSAAIRAWAVSHGLTVSERGRISASIVEAYAAGDPSRLPAATVLAVMSTVVESDETTRAYIDRAPRVEATPAPVKELAPIVPDPSVLADIANSITTHLNSVEAPQEAVQPPMPVDGPQWNDLAPDGADKPPVRLAKIQKWSHKAGVTKSSRPSEATKRRYYEFFGDRLY